MHISVDIIVAAATLAGLFGLTFYLGKSTILSALLSLYTSTILFSLFPYTKNLTAMAGTGSLKTYVPPLLFLVFFVMSFILFNSIIQTDYSSGFVSKVLGGLFVSVIFGGTLLAVLYNVLSFSQFYAFSEPIKSAFVFANALFWWFLAGLISSYFLLRR